jgi:succinyl-CoA synthetase beta subunit
MDLLEYQGKQLFSKHGVPVPEGRPAATVEEAVAAGEQLGYPVVVKAQVLIGGRGKAGGVKLAKDKSELEEHATAILGMDIKGFTVHELYIEKASEIDEEYYAAILLDRTARKPMAMLSRKGGMDIEAVADEDPSAIAIAHIDPLLGFRDFYGRKLAFEAQIADDVVGPVGAMLARLYEAFVGEDAVLVEVNPLLITKDRQVVALDSKVTIDDNAMFRHPDTAEMRNPAGEDPQEQMAHERGLTYVKLDGNIGILGNGAGLVMSTLDVVSQAGGEPANFLDAGGGSKAEAIVDAVEVILSNEKVKAVLFNIFGGITRCDEVANGLVTAFKQLEPKVPFVVRLDGTNDEEGRKILSEANLPNVVVEETMLGAADRVVELAGKDGRSPSGQARRDVEQGDQNGGPEAPRG